MRRESGRGVGVTTAVARLTSEFLATLEAAFAERVNTRLRDVVAISMVTVPQPRRKHVIQLCPSPGCKRAAAPVFGMVCAAHKSAPKATVRAWRAARRARKASRG